MSSEPPQPVVIVGAINADLVVTSDRLPRAGETVVGRGPSRHGGGKGANAAVAAARAGSTVRLVGAVGRDDMGDFALGDLRDAGVDLSGVAVLDAVATGVALIVVDGGGENQIAVGAGANGALDPAWVRDSVGAGIDAGAACVLVSTEIPGDAVVAAVRIAAERGVTCVLNTAPPIPAVLEVLDARPVLTPNRRELELLMQMLGEDGIPAEPEFAAERLSERTGRPVVVTLGAGGALVAEPGGTTSLLRPPSAAVVDTTGAGDTFSGVLTAQLAAGEPLTDAVRSAVVAGALSVARPGARGGMPLRHEIEAALRGHAGAVAR